MIVQPTPTNLRTRRQRARLVAGLVSPLVLLVVVALAGFAGSRPDARPAPSVGPATLASAGAAAASVAPAVDTLPLGIPARYDGLDAIAATESLDAATDLAASDAIAVWGYLGVDPAQSGCYDWPGAPYGAWCDRRGILAESPWPPTGTAPFPPHLRVHVPVGVLLPPVIDLAAPGQQLSPVPVLVVGRRSVRPAACQGWGPAVCDDELEIDRVAWAAGMPLGVVPLVDDRLRSSPYRIPILASLDAGELPLMAALVPSQDVWRIDSDAGARAIDVAPGQRVWYLRVAGGSRGDSAGRAVRWMLLGASDLHVLASGASGTSASTGEASLEQP